MGVGVAAVALTATSKYSAAPEHTQSVRPVVSAPTADAINQLQFRAHSPKLAFMPIPC